MIVYNITMKVDNSIAAPWLQWLRQEHAPEVVATGCFWKYQVLHLLELDDTEGPTYAVQYYAHTADDYQTYLAQHATALQKKASQRWGDRLVSFSTHMRVVD